MVKSLVNIISGLRKSLKRKIVLVSTIPFLSLVGCNYAPEAILSVYPNSGQAPLETNIQVDCTDLNGIEDIRESQLTIDREGTENDETITQENPINITRTFYDAEDINVFGKCTDLRGESDSKTTTINVIESLNHYISLEKINDVDIRYGVVLPNINQAVLTIKRNNELIHTQTIDSDYNGTLEGMLKGDYTFTLKSLDETVIEADGITIPNYAPEIDLSIIPGNEKNFNEEGQIILDLPTPTDRNPEDNPVLYVGATSLEGKVNPALNGNQLTIDGNTDETGTYQLELEFGTPEKGIGNASFEGIIANLVDISGQLQDTKTNEGAPGTIWAFKDSSYTIPLGETQADIDGMFTLQLNQVVIEAYLRGKITDSRDSFKRTVRLAPEDLLGYRTIPFSGQDISNLEIRAMPSNGYIAAGITKQDAYNHLRETNTGIWNPEGGLIRWPEEWPIVVGILSTDPLENGGPFTTIEQNFIEERFLDPIDIPLFIEGRVLDVQKNPILGVDYTVDYDQGKIIPAQGRVIIAPNKNMSYRGTNELYGTGTPGYIGGSTIELRIINSDVITHETGHALISPYHAITLSALLTILRGDILELTEPGDADEEQGYIVNEKNYVGREYAANILGVD